ncbi:hypothetical protein POX_e06818 [Penicillium oxalicum]|uniref:tRNA-splicing endonuclease subunit Sen15 domain-containing protein n=1 Tax=Penicillium oxalicum (strain 114-2 / CGMCC 5302) TaxID=933388 RepID=S8APK5_PENO1|nr:hypothetical protein POX_e06818 [Penicillium oxalicum]EPS27838.1 hypothetical protein PDE_02782 [Penicillium oxalicum 114-2]KAI2788797.1 hypothetical protein POX_e06818 [Penicillium oxalicum]
MSVLDSSALSRLIESESASADPQAATTIQILHNLQHQHFWTSLQIHDISGSSDGLEVNIKDSPRTLISGIPPHRVYTHPDEQLYMLEKAITEDDLQPERVFVIPTAQGQKWSLRRMAMAFDALASLENTIGNEIDATDATADPDKAEKLGQYYEKKRQAKVTKEWGTRRALLAMTNRDMGGDGTVVYYIVQEGEVKPRQN